MRSKAAAIIQGNAADPKVPNPPWIQNKTCLSAARHADITHTTIRSKVSHARLRLLASVIFCVPWFGVLRCCEAQIANWWSCKGNAEELVDYCVRGCQLRGSTSQWTGVYRGRWSRLVRRLPRIEMATKRYRKGKNDYRC
jgi:hypothetical protein